METKRATTAQTAVPQAAWLLSLEDLGIFKDDQVRCRLFHTGGWGVLQFRRTTRPHAMRNGVGATFQPLAVRTCVMKPLLPTVAVYLSGLEPTPAREKGARAAMALESASRVQLGYITVGCLPVHQLQRRA